jgi:hypothetical protein
MLSATIDVLPKGPESWQVRLSDGTYLWKTFDDKGDAIAKAKECAIHTSSCVVVRGLDGEVQSSRDFGMRARFYVS